MSYRLQRKEGTILSPLQTSLTLLHPSFTYSSCLANSCGADYTSTSIWEKGFQWLKTWFILETLFPKLLANVDISIQCWRPDKLDVGKRSHYLERKPRPIVFLWLHYIEWFTVSKSIIFGPRKQHREQTIVYYSPGQYAIFRAENPKIRIFTGQKNVTFLPEAGKDH